MEEEIKKRNEKERKYGLERVSETALDTDMDEFDELDFSEEIDLDEMPEERDLMDEDGDFSDEDFDADLDLEELTDEAEILEEEDFDAEEDAVEEPEE